MDTTESLLRITYPGSLKRLGPAALEIVDGNGASPPLTTSGYHLMSGRLYSVRLRMQHGGHIEVAEQWSISPDGKTIEFPQKDESSREGFVSFYPRCGHYFALRLPWPSLGKLSIRFLKKPTDEICIELLALIWPSWKNTLTWILAMLLAFRIGPRFYSLWNEKGASALNSINGMVADKWFWIELGLSTVVGLLLLRFLGCIWILWFAEAE